MSVGQVLTLLAAIAEAFKIAWPELRKFAEQRHPELRGAPTPPARDAIDAKIDRALADEEARRARLSEATYEAAERERAVFVSGEAGDD